MARDNHNLSLYRKAFCDFSAEGESVVAIESDSVVLKLQDGNILKISSRTILAMFLRILTDHGFRMIDRGISQIGIYQGQVKLLDPFAVAKD